MLRSYWNQFKQEKAPAIRSWLIAASFVVLLPSCKMLMPGKMASAKLNELPAETFGTAGTTDTVRPIKAQVFNDSDLVALIDVAIKQNADVLSAAQRIERARAEFRVRRGALFPYAGLDATGGGTRYSDYSMEGVGNYDTNLSDNINGQQRAPVPFTPFYFLGFRSNWEIDIWGKLKMRKRAAYYRYLASEQGRRWLITSLVAEVAGRYYELQAQDAELAIIKKNIELQKQATEVTSVLKETGRASELAVQQFTAQLLRTQSLEGRVQQEIVRLENEINYLLGRYSGPIKRSKLDTAANNRFALRLPVTILYRRPDVSEAEMELAASRADIEAARKAYLPALNLSPFAGFSAFNGNVLFQPGSVTYGFLAGLTGPVFNRSAIKGEYVRSQTAGNEALLQYQKTLLNAYKEVQTGVSAMYYIGNVLGNNKGEVNVLAQAVNTAKDLYLAGQASYLEVITAQKSLLDAELNTVQTERELLFNKVNLYKSIGGGW